MADEIIGSLGVEITGDYSGLTTALDQATQDAASAGTAIASAFQQAASATDLAGGSLQIFQAVLKADEAAGRDLSQSLSDLAESASTVGSAVADAAQKLLDEQQAATDAAAATQSLGDAATNAAQPVQDLGEATQQTGVEAKEASTGLEAMAQQLTLLAEALVITEGLKDFGQTALEAAAIVEKTSVSIEHLTGSASQAADVIATVKDIAATEPFAFPEIAAATQKMIALGITAGEVPGVLHAVADSAAATGNSLSTVAGLFDRMAESGIAMTRSLTTLGISWQDLRTALEGFGVAADASSKAVIAAFKDLPDEATRVEVLEQAVSRFGGTGVAVAKTLGGEWQTFQNEFTLVMADVGEALAPVVEEIVSGLRDTVIPAVESVIQAFQALPEPVKDIAVGVGIAAAALVPLTAGLAAVGLAVIGLQGVLPAVTGLLGTFGLANADAAAAETVLATQSGLTGIAITEEGVAASTATGELTGLAGSAAEAEGAAGSMALGLGPLGVAIGVVTVAATLMYGELQKNLEEMNALSNATAATPAQVDQIHNLTVALHSYNDEMALAGKNTIKIPDWNPATQSIAQYVQALQKAEDGTNRFGASSDTAKTQLEALRTGGVMLLTTAVGTSDAGVASLEGKLSKLNDTLIAAQTTLSIVSQRYQDGAATSQELAAATEAVHRAQTALNSELGVTTSHLNDHKRAWADLIVTVPTFADVVDKAIAKLQASGEKIQNTTDIDIAAFEKLSTSGTASADLISASYDKIQKDIKAGSDKAVMSTQDLADAFNSTYSAVSGLSAIVENNNIRLFQSADATSQVSTATKGYYTQLLGLIPYMKQFQEVSDSSTTSVQRLSGGVTQAAEGIGRTGTIIGGVTSQLGGQVQAVESNTKVIATYAKELDASTVSLTTVTTATDQYGKKTATAVAEVTAAAETQKVATDEIVETVTTYGKALDASTISTKTITTDISGFGESVDKTNTAIIESNQATDDATQSTGQMAKVVGESVQAMGDAYDASKTFTVQGIDPLTNATSDLTVEIDGSTNAVNDFTTGQAGASTAAQNGISPNQLLALSYQGIAGAAETAGDAVKMFAGSQTGVSGGSNLGKGGAATSQAMLADAMGIGPSGVSSSFVGGPLSPDFGGSGFTSAGPSAGIQKAMDDAAAAINKTTTSTNHLTNALTGHSLAPALDTTTVATTNLETATLSLSTQATQSSSDLANAQKALANLTTPGALPTAPGPSAGDPLTESQIATLAAGGTLSNLGLTTAQWVNANQDIKNYTASQQAYQTALQSWVTTTDNGTTSAALAGETTAQLQQTLSELQGQIESVNNTASTYADTTSGNADALANENSASDALQAAAGAVADELASQQAATEAATTSVTDLTGAMTQMSQAAASAALSATQSTTKPTGTDVSATQVDNAQGQWYQGPDGIWRLQPATAIGPQNQSAPPASAQTAGQGTTSTSTPQGTQVGPTTINSPQGQWNLGGDGVWHLTPQTTGASGGNISQSTGTDPFSSAQIATLAQGGSVQSGGLTDAQAAAVSKDVAAYVMAHPQAAQGGTAVTNVSGNYTGPAGFGSPGGYSSPTNSSTPGSGTVLNFNINGMTPSNAQQVGQQVVQALRLGAGLKI